MRLLPPPEGGFGEPRPCDSIAFRPRGFAPPRRLAPHQLCRLVASCCRLWGSSRFCFLRASRRTSGLARSCPRDACRTLRRVFLVDSRTASPRPLPPWRFYPAVRHHIPFDGERLGSEEPSGSLGTGRPVPYPLSTLARPEEHALMARHGASAVPLCSPGELLSATRRSRSSAPPSLASVYPIRRGTRPGRRGSAGSPVRRVGSAPLTARGSPMSETARHLRSGVPTR